MKVAYFAGGCFWCIGYAFERLEGVTEVESGFSGGKEINPTYEDVKAQKTSHRETIKIEYDETKISYSTLLDVFILNTDPFDSEGQFIDKGRSYTLAVYYNSIDELETAKSKIDELEKESNKKVFISLERFKSFFEAEEYHQDFYLKHKEEFKKEMEESGRNNKKKE